MRFDFDFRSVRVTLTNSSSDSKQLVFFCVLPSSKKEFMLNFNQNSRATLNSLISLVFFVNGNSSIE